MPSLRRSVTSVPALVTFEAAARLESFTRAAAELGVTQAAVSRQIRALERDLNTPLFQREHRRVELTRAGRQLSVAVTRGFGEISATVEMIRQSRSDRDITIGATLAFSHFWLVPRLAAFRRAHPGVQLRLMSQDEQFDWRRDGSQVVVRYGLPPFPGDRVVTSMTDTVFPVCSPAFLSEHGQPVTDASLFDLPLIASDWAEPSWPTWASWAEAAGMGRPKLKIALRFTHYIDTIHAALNGEGVAMGWGKLLAMPLADGSLVRLGRLQVERPEGYHVVVAQGEAINRAAEDLIGWLAQEFAKTAGYT